MKTAIKTIAAKATSKFKKPDTVDGLLASFGKTQEKLRAVIEANEEAQRAERQLLANTLDEKLNIIADAEDAIIEADNRFAAQSGKIFSENQRAERVIFNLNLLTK